MTKREKAYMDRVAALGCVVCRNLGYGETPAALHHIRNGAGMSQRNSNYLVIPLCGQHHQHGGRGVAIHAGQQAFEALYGSELDLLAQTIGDIA
jgi:hypothetical protein